MNLQEATAEEIQDYLSLSKKQMMRYFDEYSLKWSDEKREDFLNESQVFCILDPVLSGYLQLCETEDELLIYDLQIFPEYHGQGIGKKTILTVLDLANEKGLKSVRLGSFKSNPASRLYERIGFQMVKQNNYFTWYSFPIT